MAFFNEFPHTHTYDTDLAWLIKRMKEVLSRMDGVEERMKALEELVENFIQSLNIDEVIAAQLREMVANGTFATILSELLVPVEEEVEKIKKIFVPEVWYSSTEYQLNSGALKVHHMLMYAMNGLLYMSYNYSLTSGTGGTSIDNFAMTSSYFTETANQFAVRKKREYYNTVGGVDLVVPPNITNNVYQNLSWQTGYASDIISQREYLKFTSIESGNNSLSGGYYQTSGASNLRKGVSIIPFIKLIQ